jgi:hypothetical protein
MVDELIETELQRAGIDPAPPAESWTVTFTALPSDVPVVCRVRSLLKAARRSYGLKCISIATNGTRTRDVMAEADRN